MAPCVSSFAAALLAALLAGPAAAAPAPAPLEVIRASNNAVLAILARSPVVDAAVDRELFGVIDKVTDFDRLAGTIVDPFCAKLTADECRLFKETFVRLLRITSIRKLGRYRADTFDYTGEELAGETATVRTVAHFKEERIPLDYQLARRGGSWVIVNYVVDEVDTIRNYRKQFTRLFAQESFAQVIERLRHKIAENENER